MQRAALFVDVLSTGSLGVASTGENIKKGQMVDAFLANHFSS